MADKALQADLRRYKLSDVVVFNKVSEPFGGLSNMAPNFRLNVIGCDIKSSEALYQACRFPHLPDVQNKIISQASPMTAKMVGKPYRANSRRDWQDVRIQVMKWVLRVKLAQNWDSFSKLLIESGDRPIVELSRKDDFWGAKMIEPDLLIGVNALGRLLMQLREQINCHEKNYFVKVPPLKIDNFKLMGYDIGYVTAFDCVSEIELQKNLDI